MRDMHAGDPPPDIRVPPLRHRRGGTEKHRCGLRIYYSDTKAIFGKPSETVGRKAMGPNAASGRAQNCPWTILIVGRSPTIMSTVSGKARGAAPPAMAARPLILANRRKRRGAKLWGLNARKGAGQPGRKISKPPEMTGRKAMGATVLETRESKVLRQPGRRILCIRICAKKRRFYYEA